MGSADAGQHAPFPELILDRNDCDEAIRREDRRGSPSRSAICVLLAAHVVIDLTFWVGPWQFTHVPVLLFVAAWPMSQNGLIALWATTSRASSLLRFAAVVAATAGTWFLLIALIPAAVVTDSAAAGWAVAFAIQSAVIVVIGVAWGLLWPWIRSRWAADKDGMRKMQYSLGLLLLWTALIAATLSLARTAAAQFGWTSEVTRWQFFVYMPVFGTFNALYALLAFSALSGRRGLLARVVLAGCFVAVLGYFQPHVLELFSGASARIVSSETLILAGSQAAYLVATLLPLRRCGWFRAGG